ncbi:hypothetical protein BD410DRAFT_747299 [Rickenella mellea]|uniref:50S ribosomal protein L35 n=1 Tax=Rickenella mellea TaxID=50990 RepID=A0A4Y7Q7E9_9AGAM|nr:hypothetical protein BD410DRAFT_747299 [Rickenella mellea]
MFSYLFASIAPARSFATSAVTHLYKLKTHQGAKKRWRGLPNGLFKRGKAGHHHKNVTKTPGRKNRLGLTAYSTGAQTSNIRRAMPYA